MWEELNRPSHRVVMGQVFEVLSGTFNFNTSRLSLGARLRASELILAQCGVNLAVAAFLHSLLCYSFGGFLIREA